jgi:hypothetical protein
MAAGLGFKTFTTGEVLTAGDVNGYLMQGINVFTNSTARAAAITSPQEGQYSFLKDTNALEYYDGAAWVGAPVGDITAVTAGTGISGGGSSGDVTITNSMATAIDAKGDLIAGTGADAFSRLAVGANNTVLTADSTTATGLKWAAAAGGGKVLQVVNFTNSVQADSTSTSQTTVITATITPSATTSKILVLSNIAGCAMLTSGTNDWGEANMNRNAGVASWVVADRICQGMFTTGGTQPVGGFTCFTARLDEPASTSVVTYLLRFFRGNGTGTFRINSNNAVSSVTLLEIGA